MIVHGGSSFSRYSCNHTPTFIKKIGGVKYYAADAKGVEDFTGDLVINFTSRSNLPKGDIPKTLLKHIEIPFAEVMIPWPDFGLPQVKITFWKALANYVKSKKYKTVCFHCQGGHGRTGTGLSAFLIANEGLSALEAVYTIRDKHCEEAVETSGQCRYLQLVDYHYNGREPTEEEEPEPAVMSMASKYSRLAPYRQSAMYKDDDDDKARVNELGVTEPLAASSGYNWETEYEWECADDKGEDNEFEHEREEKLKSGME